MKILGIDPGFERCGFALLEKNKQKISIENFGVIRTKSQTNFTDRLHEIGRDFIQILEKHKPEIIAIEDLFFAKNVTTGIKVAEVRGMILYLASEAGCIIYEPKPVEIKKTFTGNGQATKSEMYKMTQLLFSLKSSEKILDDAIDAIAIAFCGFSYQG